MDPDKIFSVISNFKWPTYISSDVRIRETVDSLVIEIPRMPLLAIYTWMAFVYIAIISVFIWKAPSELPVVIPMGFLSSVGFCFIMRFLEKKRVEAGPYAIISDKVWNYEKRNVEIGDIKEATEVFFTAKKRSGKESYRVLVISGTEFAIPIMWQIANRHKWTRPKLDLIERRLGIKVTSIQIKPIMDEN